LTFVLSHPSRKKTKTRLGWRNHTQGWYSFMRSEIWVLSISLPHGEIAMQDLLHDLKFVLRQLRKTPGVALLAVLTLALGANTAIFTVIEDVLLQPLPYLRADRLVFVGTWFWAEWSGNDRCGL
jgi:hypothetical protein